MQFHGDIQSSGGCVAELGGPGALFQEPDPEWMDAGEDRDQGAAVPDCPGASNLLRHMGRLCFLA